MIKEIITDKNFIVNVIRRFILWMINLMVVILILFFILSFINGESFFERLSLLSPGLILRMALAMILLVTISEILREYKKRYTS